MLELFIALFGGIYYGVKLLGEREKTKAYDEEEKLRSSTRESIEARYMASYETEQWAKDFVSNGEHYDDICNWFAEDLQYVFGDEWREKLRIPTQFLPLVCLYGKKSYPWGMPSAHVMWVYHLLLAKKGKIDHTIIGFGYPIGGINEKDMCVKFAQRIEENLLKAGVQGIRLALELDMICGTIRRTPSDLCNGNIKIEALCICPTHRLW